MARMSSSSASGTLAHDVRIGFAGAMRSLRRQPVVTATVVLILALGIGASTAMLSVVRGVLVHSVPYAREQELVQVTSSMPKQNLTQILVALPRLEAYNVLARAFTGFAAFAKQDFFVTDGPVSISVSGARVSPDFFRTLEVAPIRGRGFTAEEQTRGGPHAVIIDERLWRAQFGGVENIIGKSMTINGAAEPVVGVVPARFAPPLQDVQVLMPRIYEPDFVPPEQVERGSAYLRVIGRLKPGVTPAAAQADLQRVVMEYRATSGALRDATFDAAVDPLSTYLFGKVRDSLVFLWLAGTLVFLIACANAGNVLLARYLDRRQELDIRTAMGGTRRQLVLHLLAECALLAAGAVALGLSVAVGIRFWLASLAGQVLATSVPFSFDATVYLVAAVLGTLAVLIAGTGPALQATAEQHSSLVAAGSRRATSGRGASRWRRVLVVAQVAVSYALLAGALQQAAALLKIQQMDRGFDAAGLTSFQIAPSAIKYATPDSRLELYRRIEELIAASPGVTAVGASQAMPVGDDQTIAFIPEVEHARKPDEWPHAQFRIISTGYHGALGVGLRSGRGFTSTDSRDGPSVAVVNETLARRFFGSGGAVGQRIFLGSQPVPREIVGVVSDVRQAWLEPVPQPEVYVPGPQMWVRLPPMYFVVRSRQPAPALIAAIRAQVATVDPVQSVTRVQDMEAVAAAGLAVPRMRATLIVAFAVLGTVLAAIGLWSVMSQFVAEQKRELGIRMALGAPPSAAMALVLRAGLVVVVLGVAVGLAGALVLGRVARHALSGVESPSPLMLGGAGALLLAIGGVAAFLPAVRAARLDPVKSIGR
ncbi:MAG TPA: ADOP family duplicated permease [Gemmatimonadaceae bacterium]|nr:ADOP family duplicated permease [Gemmatimonadaceae bacterium]